MNLSELRAGGDVTADRLPACMLRTPTVCVPSLQPPHHPAPLLLSQSSAPHICCVLATDSKLQHPGPLSDSIPISSHVPLLSLQHHYPAHLLLRLSISLLFLSFWSVFLPLSVIFVLALRLPQPCQISLPFLSFSHFSYTSHPPFFYCVTLHSASSLTHLFRSPFTFLQGGPSCLGFTGFSAASPSLSPALSSSFLSLSPTLPPSLPPPLHPSLSFWKQMLFVRSYHYWLIKKTSLLLLLLLLFPLLSRSVASIPDSLFFSQRGSGRTLSHTCYW